jgi:hypothetical protein
MVRDVRAGQAAVLLIESEAGNGRIFVTSAA